MKTFCKHCKQRATLKTAYGNAVCGKCREAYYWKCKSCKKFYIGDDVRIASSLGAMLCKSCK